MSDQISRRSFLGRGATLVGGAAVLAPGLAACGGGGSTTSGGTSTASGEEALSTDGKPGAGKTIGVSLIGINEYTLNAATGVLKELEPAGYATVVLQSNFTPEDEIKNFESLISKGVDGILVLPVTPDSAARGALNADRAGIPTVDLAWAKPTAADSIYVGRVRLNNVRGGRMIADWLSRNAEPGQIVVVQGAPGNEFSDDFDSGLKSGVESLGGDWAIVGSQPGNYLREEAITAAENLLTANPEASIIITAAAEMGVGVASYLRREGLKDITHVTSDGNAEMLTWMRRGYIAADRYFSSGLSGELGAQQMRDYLESGEKSEIVDIEMSMETPETIQAAVKAQPLGYPEYMKKAQAAA